MELRSGARFCSKCGQRVIGEEPAADGPGPEAADRSGAAFTEVGSQHAAPASGWDAPLAAPQVTPAQPPQDDWSDWYRDTVPRVLDQSPANQRAASPPPAYQQPAAPSPSPLYPQAYRTPFEPPSATPSPDWLPGLGGPGGQGGSDGPSGRSRAPLFWSVLSAAVVAAAVVLLLLLHPFSHHETLNNAANSTGTTPPGSTAAAHSPAASALASASPSASAFASISSTAVTEQRAASTVAGMLSSSVADRTAIDSAFSDVDSCGPNLDSDAAVFTRAASSRHAMLASLDALLGRSALPPALLSDLASAWQASIAADQDYATWANDEVTQGCVHGDTNDPGYRATIAPDNEANEYKTAFVAQWNPIAASYDLTTYQPSQL